MSTTPRHALAVLAGLIIALAGAFQSNTLARASSPAPHTLSGTVPTVVAAGQAHLLGRVGP